MIIFQAVSDVTVVGYFDNFVDAAAALDVSEEGGNWKRDEYGDWANRNDETLRISTILIGEILSSE